MSNYIVKTLENKTDWEKFLRLSKFNLFVQSWYYGEFNRAMGDDAFVLGVFDHHGDRKELVGGSLVVVVNAKRGKFFYLPYGPVLDFENKQLVESFFNELKYLAKHKGVDFIRVSPFLEDSAQHRQLFKDQGFKKSPIHMIAEHTTILQLDGDELELLKNMNQNHRNLIRRAQRDGIEIRTSEEVLDVKILHNLLQETSKRHSFTPFSLKYLENEFRVFQNRGEAKLYFAYHEGDLLGAAMIFFYGNSTVYRHSASSSVKSKMPSSYAIQWEAIQESKRRGITYYNFWGIAPEGNKKHPFYGITHFKKGFGGFLLDLVPAQDFAITKKYWFNWIIETARKFKRGF